MKQVIAIVLALTLILSAQVFADENTTTQPVVTETTATAEPVVQPTQPAGITPDSPLYALDKLIERIQLSLITDSVKKAEELAKISQERLSESDAMLAKSDIELAQKALGEYKTSLEQAVTLVETAMASGKQVADVMNDINSANLKDAAVVEKIVSSIPEQFRVEVKAEIEKLAAATEAAAETTQVVENEPVEENSIKTDITLKIIQEKIKDEALLAKIKAAGLNTRQIIAVMSLSEQSKKPLAEVIDLFRQNEMGIGATTHALGLSTKDALKGINGSFKETKGIIKKAFKEAIKTVNEDDREEVQALVNNTLANQVDEANQKLEKVVKEAKEQVEAITTAAVDKQDEKLKEKAEKAIEKIEKLKDKTKYNSSSIVNNDKGENNSESKNQKNEKSHKSIKN